MKGGFSRHATHAAAAEDRNTPANEQSSEPWGNQKHDTPTHSLSDDLHMPTGDVGPESDQPILNSTCATEVSLRHGEFKHQSIMVSQERDEAAAPGTDGGLQYEESRSASCEPDRDGSLARHVSPAARDSEKQPPCSRPETDAVLERPSVIIANFRSEERGMRNSALSTPTTLPNKKRGRSEPQHHGNSSSDDPDDSDDADYVCESTVSSRRPKRARQTAVRRAPGRPRHNARCPSIDDVAEPKATVNHGSLSSLPDLETIPIRGFLTRQILLSKVVYSVTIEEQKEHTCLQESHGVPSHCQNETASQTQPHQKRPCIRKSTGSTRFLPKDDQLLIELKEERGLPWKRIAEYFPERSIGSLQVRYCTRLKSRRVGNSERSYNVENKSSYRRISRETF